MLKKIIPNIFAGIAWGCTFACIVNIIGSMVIGIDWFATMKHGYVTQTLVSMAVGIAWVLPALIYQNDNISMGFQVSVHMGIGFLVYFPSAFYLGWIPTEFGIWPIAGCIIFVFVMAFAIWFCFYLHYKNEVKKINEKISKIS